MDGTLKRKIYIGAYTGYKIGNVLKSICGASYNTGTGSYDAVRSYAQANGQGHDIYNWSDTCMVNDLMFLITMNLQFRTTFGYGNYTYSYDTGGMNAKGMCWGSGTNVTGASNGVKVFGLEHWWGHYHEMINGILFTNAQGPNIKMTYGTEDGSSTVGFNSSGQGYIDTNLWNGIQRKQGYIIKSNYSSLGLFPVEQLTGGSDSTYYTQFTQIYDNGYPLITRFGYHVKYYSSYQGPYGLTYWRSGYGDSTMSTRVSYR